MTTALAALVAGTVIGLLVIGAIELGFLIVDWWMWK